MPAQSKAQQRFFGVVKAMQKGDKPKEGEAGKVAKSMKKKDVDDFASTKHKGKPEKVKREMKVRNLIKNMVREELQENMCFDLQTERCWKGYTQKGMKKMFGKMYPNCVKIKKKKSENVAPNHDGKAAPFGSGYKKTKERKLKEGFDLKKLEDAIKMFQKKIKKQGRVTNARDEEHLKQLIKVYKNMGGKRIKESVWGLPKGSNTTNMDELDAALSRAGIKSIPDFTKLIVQVKGNKSKINKIMKTHKAKKIFEGKRQQLSIPVMDKLKTDKILKKLRLKPGKDYDVGVGSRNSFILDIEGKYLDKLITLLMKQRIRVR